MVYLLALYVVIMGSISVGSTHGVVLLLTHTKDLLKTDPQPPRNLISGSSLEEMAKQTTDLQQTSVSLSSTIS